MSGPTPGLLTGPISDSLARHLDAEVGRVPSGRRGQVSVAVTTTGLALGVGYRPAPALAVSGYAERLWGGRGWTAAARAQLLW